MDQTQDKIVDGSRARACLVRDRHKYVGRAFEFESQREMTLEGAFGIMLL